MRTNPRHLRGTRGGRAARGPAAALTALLAGCAALPQHFDSPARRACGIVYILPGIEGRSVLNHDIAHGLHDGGVPFAIRIYDWTTPLPGGLLFNLSDLERNRAQAAELAGRIVRYREDHPGAPVHLIGHSGGGGIAVLAVEALPAGRQIDRLVLLAPALGYRYDLTTALRRTRIGLHCFWSEHDVGILKVGTTLFGAIDRTPGVAAGAAGFEPPPDLSPAGLELYDARLHNIRWTPRLAPLGADGSHFGWAARRFARRVLAPLVMYDGAGDVLPHAAAAPAR
ncbi:MAG: alpha/beta hydrolase [Phycisphaerae bacterium]